MHHAGEHQHVVEREARLGDDVLLQRLDERAGDFGVEQALVERPLQHATQEVLLTSDAAEVRGPVLVGLALAVHPLEVA